jgi:hypothetical protein
VELRLDVDEEIWLSAGDITQLYPNMEIVKTLYAVEWFMDNHAKFSKVGKDFSMALSKFVLENSYAEYENEVYTSHWDGHGHSWLSTMVKLFCVSFGGQGCETVHQQFEMALL